MDERVFNHQFHDHLKSLYLNFNNTDFANVIIVCDDGSKILTNKILLSSFSPFLKRILLDRPEEVTLLKIEGAKYQEMELLLQFLCSGEARLTQFHVDQLCSLAQQLNISKFDPKPKYDNIKRNEQIEDDISKQEEFIEVSLNPKNKGKSVSRKCEVCSKDFRTRVGYTQHVEAQHMGIRPYPCSYCDFKARYQSALEVHVKSVHVGIKYPCDMCDYKGPLESHVKRHKDSVHGLGKRFPCMNCQRTYPLYETLKRHIREVHKKENILKRSHSKDVRKTTKKEKVQIDIVDYTLEMRQKKLAAFKMNLLGLNKTGKKGRPKGSLSWKEKWYVENFLDQEKNDQSKEKQPTELNDNNDHKLGYLSPDYNVEEVFDKIVVCDPLDLGAPLSHD